MPPDDRAPKREIKDAAARLLTSHLANLSLDNTPVRNKANNNLPSRDAPTRPPESIFARPAGPGVTALPAHPAEPESCSPTPSEIDALEQSFYHFELQSSLASETKTTTLVGDGESSAGETHDAYGMGAWAGGQVSYPSLSSSLDDAQNLSTPQLIDDRLRYLWPKSTIGLDNAPLAAVWEITRTAVHCNVDPSQLSIQWQDSWRDYETFWAAIKAKPAFQGHKLPVKSDPRAWRIAIEGDQSFLADNEAVVLTSVMHPTHSKTDSTMRLELHPLTREQSSRLFRRYGADRFLEVRMPSLEGWQLGDVEEDVARWLTDGEHSFLERHWSAFYVRDRPMKVDGLEEGKAVFYDRILFFAESGRGIAERRRRSARLRQENSSLDRMACSRSDMLDWLLNWKNNGAQSYLKLFHRVALGLSKTNPVVILDEHQIRHRTKDLLSPTGEVMNDGAARISPSLMKKVRDAMGLQTIPSAIQGRVGSAKGMWVVDVTDHGSEDWIETFPSQRKWKCDFSKEQHRTLEVRSWSRELVSASLNIQFLPILEDRAVNKQRMRATFVENMFTDAEQGLAVLKEALAQPQLLRKYIRDTTPQPHARLLHRAVPFLAGLPDDHIDKIAFLLDGGFEPLQTEILQRLIFETQRKRGDKMKRELKIKLGKSTYAYMLPDFWGVLAPDEVYLAFSSEFGQEAERDLDGVEVLVARAPAHLPSDVQKVRAVFKAELRHLRDVIVFSAKGEEPLAGLLSGGDYDGDIAWVCWDEAIVGNFRNHEMPPKPDFSRYLRKNRGTLDDLLVEFGSDDYLDVMMNRAFRFNLRKSFLGPCTAYKEKALYHLYHVSSPQAIRLSWLLSELADQPKQGILFGQKDWACFKDDVISTQARRELPVPAYKGGPPRKGHRNVHIIDFLMLKAKRVVDESLAELHRFLQATGAGTYDYDLVQYWDRFESGCTGAGATTSWFGTLREGLKMDVDALVAEWNRAMAVDGGSGKQNYRENVVRLFEVYRAIQPRLPEAMDDPTAVGVGLLQRDSVVPELSNWELLKASFVFKQHHHRRLVWQLAGRQLQALKALAAARCSFSSASPPVLVTASMYAALKPDNTYIKRLRAVDDEDEDEGEETEASESDLLPWTSSGIER